MFELELVTYKGIYKTLNVDSINIPTPDGRRGILPNRMPIMLPIDIGIMKVVIEGKETRYTVSRGMFYFADNKSILLADNIEDVAEIDVNRARLAQERALERLSQGGRDSDIHRAEVALRKAINRIEASENE